MSLNLHLYRHFIALAEELHFGRAATRLHIVQPALTRSIKILEETIGVSLVDRTSRQVSLTPAGAAFLIRARATVAQFDDAIRTAQLIGSGATTPLRIGFGSAAMFHVFPELMRLFYRRYEEAECSVTEGPPEQLMMALKDQQIDVAVVQREYVSGPPIRSRTLYSAGMIAVIPASWPLAQRSSIQLRELRDLPFVFFPPVASSMTYSVIMSVCSRCGLTPTAVRSADGTLAMLCLVGSGLGFTLLNEGMSDFPVGNVAYVPIADPEARNLFQYELAWNGDNASKSLLNFLVAADDVLRQTA